MMKLALLLWIIIGTTVAGIGMVAVVATPSLADQAMLLIPLLCGAGFLIAVPISWMVAKKIDSQARTA